MKRNLMIGIAIATIIIVVVASVTILDQESKEKDVGGGPGNWQVGDYWEYNITFSGTGNWDGWGWYHELNEVVHVNSTVLVIKTTYSGPSYNDGQSQSEESGYLVEYVQNLSSASFEAGGWGISLVPHGNETLSTKWGERTTEHYSGSWGNVTDFRYHHFDYWFIDGFIYKTVETQYLNDEDNQRIITVTLISTNLPQILD